jgi:hypothetical protein
MGRGELGVGEPGLLHLRSPSPRPAPCAAGASHWCGPAAGRTTATRGAREGVMGRGATAGGRRRGGRRAQRAPRSCPASRTCAARCRRGSSNASHRHCSRCGRGGSVWGRAGAGGLTRTLVPASPTRVRCLLPPSACRNVYRTPAGPTPPTGSTLAPHHPPAPPPAARRLRAPCARVRVRVRAQGSRGFVVQEGVVDWGFVSDASSGSSAESRCSSSSSGANPGASGDGCYLCVPGRARCPCTRQACSEREGGGPSA